MKKKKKPKSGCCNKLTRKGKACARCPFVAVLSKKHRKHKSKKKKKRERLEKRLARAA